MSHMHLPFGVISPVWAIAGYMATLAILFFCVRRINKEELSKKVPFIGVISALMLITMSIPLGFLPFHINLTVLSGIIAGPYLGFTSVFIVNLFLALLGHGGIDAVGINTLIIGFETVAGYFLFNRIRKRIQPTAAAAVTTVATLLVSTVLMVGVIGMTNAGWEYALPHDEEEHGIEQKYGVEQAAGEENVDAVKQAETKQAETKQAEARQTETKQAAVKQAEITQAEAKQAETKEASAKQAEAKQAGAEKFENALEAVQGQDEGAEGFGEHLSEIRLLSLSGWSAVLAILLLGILLEALATTLIVRFFIRVRPDIVLVNRDVMK